MTEKSKADVKEDTALYEAGVPFAVCDVCGYVNKGLRGQCKQCSNDLNISLFHIYKEEKKQ